FRCAPASGLKSGFNECWEKALGNELGQPMVFDIWCLNSGRRDHSSEFIRDRKYLIKSLTDDDINPPAKPSGVDAPAWSPFDRKKIQWRKVVEADTTPEFVVEGLKNAIGSWTFPLHFIDFETATAALPFNKGRHPYETLAFQFSHHTVTKDGKVAHAGQFLHAVPGEFPNFHFLRELKRQLSTDEGTIFRFHNHENTVLRKIRNQLDDSNEADKAELTEWIDTVTQWKDGAETVAGRRNMVDLQELVRHFYYHPATNGSCSLKAVLPAIIRESTYLRSRYEKPVYGGDVPGGIPSLNFRDEPIAWFQMDPVTRQIADPYKLLKPVLPALIPADYLSSENEENDDDGGAINNGGLAMMAYCAMQFTDMDQAVRRETCEQLLRYCELDTLAMVMLYEHFLEIVNAGASEKTP
ncbi:MAG: DUF2779 domain-containing protein, partial [Proteobacteria bacterium]|nr:DUF2779 domain-containing protein [Pseudomonadota bacterium]